MGEGAVLLLCTVIVVASLVAMFGRRSKHHRYPPGPGGLPIVGNLFDVPADFAWFTFASWARRYASKIIYLNVLGRDIVILNGYKVAKDLFEERSRNYSDRPHTVMTHELTGWHRNFAIIPYGECWQQRRRLFHQHFRPQAMPAHHDKMMKGAHTLVQLLLESPDDFLRHFRHISGSIILDVVYGMDVGPRDNAAMESVEKAVESFGEIADAGAYLVDFIPVLRHLPSWFLGAGFKRQGAQWKIWVDRMFDGPYQEVKSDMMAGKSRPCVTSALLHEFADKLDDRNIEENIISVSGTTYAASDTTIYAMATFAFAMLLFPDVQRKAQEELDRVVGRDRLPDLNDRDSLPYVSAIMKEIVRWRPIGPTAVPHKSVADDWYDGYFIPAGCIVIGNVWAILHDEERYPDPEAFKPERFLTAEGTLDPSVPDPTEVFGFGRRICPGRYYAYTALFLYMSHVLAAFTIQKAVDEEGNLIEPTQEHTSRLFWYPKPFKASIKPRLGGLDELIKASEN